MKKINRCPLCSSSKLILLVTTRDRMFDLPGLFTLKKCRQCSMIFLDPCPTQSELKKYYPNKIYYAYQKRGKKDFFGTLRDYLIARYYQPTFLSKIISIFIHNVPAIPSYCKNGKIIDLGCGNGGTLLLLKKLGWIVYGLDIDKKAIAIANKQGLNNVKLGSYKDLTEYPDNYFEAIRLYHVIEHLDNPTLCLRLIHRKLKKGGELIIGTPNVASFTSRLFGRYWLNLDTPRHLFLFTPKTLKKMMEKEDFMMKQIEFCSAGGIVGSLQYFLSDAFGKRINLLNIFWLVVLIYPLEWLLDKLKRGDIFVIRATIKQRGA